MNTSTRDAGLHRDDRRADLAEQLEQRRQVEDVVDHADRRDRRGADQDRARLLVPGQEDRAGDETATRIAAPESFGVGAMCRLRSLGRSIAPICQASDSATGTSSQAIDRRGGEGEECVDRLEHRPEPPRAR